MWNPADSVVVVTVATPEPLRVPVPMDVAPSRKLTVPVAGPPLPVTVAVKVRLDPAVVGFGLDVTAVLDADLLTTWLSAVEVLVLCVASPL